VTARHVYRYVSGRPMDGRTGYPYLSKGEGRWPGWKRQVARLSVPAAGIVTLADPQAAEAGGMVLGITAAYALRRRWLARKFRRAYLNPTLAALRPGVGVNDIRLHVDPGLGNLTPRLAKPLSPAEERVRAWYGAHVEPVLRWAPDRLWRATRGASGLLEPVRKPFRRPVEKPGPRIQLDVATEYLTDEQRKLVQAIITSKIPVADLVPKWDMVGPTVTATWTVRRRPPAKVGRGHVLEALPGLQEWEFFLGLGLGGDLVTLSLHEDSPHLAVSAGTGAGKSVLAQLIAVQVLARGGMVTILDRKGSHRWARNLPGVDYCSRPDQMHNALIRLATLSSERNDLSFYEADGWDPGARQFVICEELNATIGQLTNYWQMARDKSDPKKSPAVSALADLLFMGRSAKVNVLAVAQMLTARAIGGPEARENFGIRCLARYTANNWKMLVPEAAMPRASRVLGRWQIVVGGVATETQVAFLTQEQARAIATPMSPRAETPDSPLTWDFGQGQGHSLLITLTEACDEGVLPWKYEAAKKRIQRRWNNPPRPRGKRANTDLYSRSELAEWVA
jgi:hypothetical protein